MARLPIVLFVATGCAISSPPTDASLVGDAELHGCDGAVVPADRSERWMPLSNSCAWADRAEIVLAATRIRPAPGEVCEAGLALVARCDGAPATPIYYSEWDVDHASGFELDWCPGVVSDVCTARYDAAPDRLSLSCSSDCEILFERYTG